jgi:hypothetical protein
MKPRLMSYELSPSTVECMKDTHNQTYSIQRVNDHIQMPLMNDNDELMALFVRSKPPSM